MLIQHTSYTIGPGNCVGRLLALQEMRTIIAAFVRRFDVQFAPGFQHDDWTTKLGDQYILVRGPLPVVMNKRV
jgi:cytochrome P450